MSLSRVKKIILVVSGKGGVGKSSVSVQLALSLSRAGHSVGVLDIDLTGPNIPLLFRLEDAKVTQILGGWQPIPVHAADPARGIGALRVMSLGFLLPSRGDAVVWRGPKKTAMVRQFLSDVAWGETDYLIIDTPPGTSDEHISLAEEMLAKAAPGQLAGAVVVTIPSAVSVADVRKELNFLVKTGIPVLGVVENMRGFVCENCSELHNIFSSGGGEDMATEFKVPFLGSVLFDTQFQLLLATGKRPKYAPGTISNGEDMAVRGQGGPEEAGPLVEEYGYCYLEPVFRDITQKVVETASRA